MDSREIHAPLRGDALPAKVIQELVARALQSVVGGKGIRVDYIGRRIIISSTYQAIIPVGGGLRINSYDTFPAIPSVPTIIQVYGQKWEADDGDTRWRPMSDFTDKDGLPE